MQGQLGEKLVTDLVREIAHKNLSGLLRLTRGKTIKAIFFEAGAPRFAISNLTNEQLEHKLVSNNLATLSQVEEAKQRLDKPHRLASMLVEMNVMPEADMRKLVHDQLMEIILSLFDWTQGDYAFDTRIRASHDFTLEVTAADVILEGARKVSTNDQMAESIAPMDAILVRAKSNGISLDSGRLMPVESYILSRIESPTSVSDVGALSGIGDQDAHRAVCALVAAGFLKLLGDDKNQEEEPDRQSVESADKLREEVARQLHFYSSADFYEVLGVGRLAKSAEIKAAYYQLAKKFHPDRHREHGDLRQKLESLFAVITQAYETLSESGQRAAYDDRLKKPAASFQTTPLKQMPMIVTDPKPVETAAKSEEAKDSGDLKPTSSQVKSSGPLAQPQNDFAISDAQQSSRNANSGAGSNPAQMAEHYYNQGRARFDRKEYHVAVHLLREAIKLDPSRPPYHFHLGVALIRNPRARREADEHLAKAAELDPYNAQIRVKLGLIYKEAGLPKKAESYFRAALQLDPDNRAARREVSGKKVSKSPDQSIWKSDIGSIAKRIFKK
ncbi:MAG TPA: DnaJ domain-containing protein [Blastocatellia bacterium]|nr:DnaJ domain-containing protein [Blastocatellia bacterium]